MSRNNERMSAPELDAVAAPAPQPSQVPAPGSQAGVRDLFSFSTAHTEIVDLPSKGRFYPPNHPLHNRDYVEIKYMTAAQEDILTNKSLIKKGLALDRLIQSLLVEPIDVTTLLTGDKSAIIIAARIGGFGSDYETKVQCTACSHVNEQIFDLDTLKPKEYGFDNAEFIDELGTFKTILPKLGVEVHCRLLRGEDEMQLYNLNEAKKSRGLPETPSVDTMKKMIVAVAGETDAGKLAIFIEHNLSTLDARYLRHVYQKMNPTMDTEFAFQCQSCSYVNRVDMPMTSDFFWPAVK